MHNKYDVVIIGAGVAGLIAGTCLAKKGLKVLIAERNNVVGGCYSSFRRGEFKFDSVAQIIGSCGRREMLGSILNELDIRSDMIRLNPTDMIHFPNETVRIDNNFKEFEAYLQDRFRSEKAAIAKFFDLIAGTASELKTLYVMKKYESKTYQNLLDKFFKDKVLKGILSSQCGCLGLPPKELAATSAIFLLKTYLVDGAFYPRSGSQAFSDAISGAFRRFGGETFLNAEVQKILVENNRVKGIVLKDAEILADFVIVASDVTKAYRNLIGLDKIKNNKVFYKKLNNFRFGKSSCIVYLGLKNRVNLTDKNGWYYPSYDINKDLHNFMNIHIPTNYDESVSKKGNPMLAATFFFDYGKDSRGNRGEFKNRLMKKFLCRIEREIPGTGENIIVKDIATPLTIEKYTLNSRGAIGWNPIPSQTHLNSFPVASSIDGLFHAGQWTLPGGGIVAVATSGKNVAGKVFKKVISKNGRSEHEK